MPIKSTDLCAATTDPISSCTATISQEANIETEHFFFTFSECATPIIDQISPNSGTSSTTLALRGTGFGDSVCQNTIMVGEHECVASFANSTYIECDVDTEDSLMVGELHAVSVTVNNRGLGINQVMTPAGRAFRMLPSVDEISLASGSLEGGTRLLMTGDGFSADSPDDVRVIIGGTPCVVDTVGYKAIECVTTKPLAEGTFEPILTINYAEAEVCNRSACRYTYDSASTPVVSVVSPVVVTGPSTVLTVTGAGFGSDSDGVVVSVGGVNCDVLSAKENEIQCDVGYVPVGNAELIVNIPEQGNSVLAFDGDETTLWSDPNIDSISPSVGSMHGGQTVTIAGNGFHIDSTTVAIDNLDCAIVSISISEIQCQTDSHSSGIANLVVTSGEQEYPAIDYEYSTNLTPEIHDVSPSNGESGSTITVTGVRFEGATLADNTVTIDGVDCAVTSATDSSITCTVGDHSAGEYEVEVHVNGKGNAMSGLEFEYVLAVDATTPSESKSTSLELLQ